MDNVKEFIAKAHKSADKSILNAQKSVSMVDVEKVKEWLSKPMVVKTGHFAGVYFALFAILMYQVIMF